jgi:flagellar basal-body rod modification protein FlgD
MTTATTNTSSSVLNTTTAAAASSQVNSGLASLTSNFQSFLSLLTTQLQNQDPTNPMDTDNFTQEIVSMTGVQQQLLANNLLTTLVAQGQGGLANGVNYIGKTVEATDPTQTLANNQIAWNYTLPTGAASANITVTNSMGNTVYSGAAPSLTSGVNSFTWNGKDSSGNQLANGGTYTMAVKALDGAGNTLNSQIVTQGTVSAATVNNGTAYLTINGASVPVSSVISVQNAATNTGSTSQ